MMRTIGMSAAVAGVATLTVAHGSPNEEAGDVAGAAVAALEYAKESLGERRGVLLYRGHVAYRQNVLEPDTIGLDSDAVQRVSEAVGMQIVYSLDDTVLCDAHTDRCAFIGEEPGFEIRKPRVRDREATIIVGVVYPDDAGQDRVATFGNIQVELYWRVDGTWQVRSALHEIL